jgi:hypothetical protein
MSDVQLYYRPGKYTKQEYVRREVYDALEARLEAVNSMLYRAVRELEYVQSVENCNSGLCASAEGRDVVEAGMKLLGVADLSGDTLATTKMSPKERP